MDHKRGSALIFISFTVAVLIVATGFYYSNSLHRGGDVADLQRDMRQSSSPTPTLSPTPSPTSTPIPTEEPEESRGLQDKDIDPLAVKEESDTQEASHECLDGEELIPIPTSSAVRLPPKQPKQYCSKKILSEVKSTSPDGRYEVYTIEMDDGPIQYVFEEGPAFFIRKPFIRFVDTETGEFFDQDTVSLLYQKHITAMKNSGNRGGHDSEVWIGSWEGESNVLWVYLDIAGPADPRFPTWETFARIDAETGEYTSFPDPSGIGIGAGFNSDTGISVHGEVYATKGESKGGVFSPLAGTFLLRAYDIRSEAVATFASYSVEEIMPYWDEERHYWGFPMSLTGFPEFDARWAGDDTVSYIDLPSGERVTVRLSELNWIDPGRLTLLSHRDIHYTGALVDLEYGLKRGIQYPVDGIRYVDVLEDAERYLFDRLPYEYRSFEPPIFDRDLKIFIYFDNKAIYARNLINVAADEAWDSQENAWIGEASSNLLGEQWTLYELPDSDESGGIDSVILSPHTNEVAFSVESMERTRIYRAEIRKNSDAILMHTREKSRPTESLRLASWDSRDNIHYALLYAKDCGSAARGMFAIDGVTSSIDEVLAWYTPTPSHDIYVRTTAHEDSPPLTLGMCLDPAQGTLQLFDVDQNMQKTIISDPKQHIEFRISQEGKYIIYTTQEILGEKEYGDAKLGKKHYHVYDIANDSTVSFSSQMEMVAALDDIIVDDVVRTILGGNALYVNSQLFAITNGELSEFHDQNLTLFNW